MTTITVLITQRLQVLTRAASSEAHAALLNPASSVVRMNRRTLVELGGTLFRTINCTGLVAMMILGGIAVVAGITYFKNGATLWNRWFTSSIIKGNYRNIFRIDHHAFAWFHTMRL